MSIGGQFAEVIYFGPAPGYESLSQINIRVPADLKAGDAIPLRIIELDRPSNTFFVSLH